MGVKVTKLIDNNHNNFNENVLPIGSDPIVIPQISNREEYDENLKSEIAFSPPEKKEDTQLTLPEIRVEKVSPRQDSQQKLEVRRKPSEPFRVQGVPARKQFDQSHSIESYKKGTLLGSGASGSVYISMDQTSGFFFALKEISFENVSPELLDSKLTQIQQEINVMKKLTHQNIVRYLGARKKCTEYDGTKLHIFMNYIPGGSLQKVLKTFGRLSQSVVQNYTKQLLKGLQYLHEEGIIHRDIKCANILVDVDGTVRLSDFGCSRQIQKLKQFKTLIGTPNYMAPEVIKQMGYGIKIDIWSLGCTVLEMLTGQPPFAEYVSIAAVLFHIASTNDPPTYPDFISADAKDFLNLCFIRDQDIRPNTTKLLEHVWVKNVKYEEEVRPPPVKAVVEQKAENKKISKLKNSHLLKFDSFGRSVSTGQLFKRSSLSVDSIIPEKEKIKLRSISRDNIGGYIQKVEYPIAKQGSQNRLEISNYLMKSSTRGKKLFEKDEKIDKRHQMFVRKKFEDSKKELLLEVNWRKPNIMKKSKKEDNEIVNPSKKKLKGMFKTMHGVNLVDDKRNLESKLTTKILRKKSESMKKNKNLSYLENKSSVNNQSLPYIKDNKNSNTLQNNRNKNCSLKKLFEEENNLKRNKKLKTPKNLKHRRSYKSKVTPQKLVFAKKHNNYVKKKITPKPKSNRSANYYSRRYNSKKKMTPSDGIKNKIPIQIRKTKTPKPNSRIRKTNGFDRKKSKSRIERRKAARSEGAVEAASKLPNLN